MANKISNYKLVALAWNGKKKNFLGMATNIPVCNRNGQAHAEVRLGKKCNLRGTIVEVRRYTSEGKLSMAKPCPRCEAYLRAAKVKAVRYSSWDGQIKTMWF